MGDLGTKPSSSMAEVQTEQIPPEVEQPYFVPDLQRSALPRFHRRDAPARSPRRCHFANMTLLDRGACRMVEDSGGPGWQQP